MALTPEPNRLAGVAALTRNGQSYLLVGDFGYVVSTVKRETQSGADGVHGFKETPIPGAIFGTLRDAGNISVAAINQGVSDNVVLELANGKTISGDGLWTVESQEVKSSDATFEVRWEGFSVNEMLATAQ
jgi:Phage tail tube protein